MEMSSKQLDLGLEIKRMICAENINMSLISKEREVVAEMAQN